MALFGIVHYKPNRLPGETEDTISQMKKLMVDESKKLKRNRSKISELMDRTFADRRQLSFDGVRFQCVKENFPCLFDEEEVRNFT
jgi:hypothetical protein